LVKKDINQVVGCIENVLNIKGKSLDYDKLFENSDQAIGI
jgi:hypothetical protein